MTNQTTQANNSTLTTQDRSILGVANLVGATLQALLENRLNQGVDQAFYIWLRPDRLIVSIDPLAVKSIDQVLSEKFRHQLSTVLGGRRVVPTNSRGIFYQISYWPMPPKVLKSEALDLSKQPSPLHLPIGNTRTGPLWLPITELDSILIGGSRGMGKSTLLHGWIQALLSGNTARLYLWDGKENAEFGRYASQGVVVDVSLERVLDELQHEVLRRKEKMLASGYGSVAEYNERNPLPIPPLVLIIDEAAFIPEDSQAAIVDLVARGRAWGVYPILATQRPGAEQVQGMIKTNLTTRISLPVPDVQTSQIILGRPGAERLPRQPGMLLFERGAKLIRALAFSIDKPQQPESDKPTGADIDLFRRAKNETGGKLTIGTLMEWGTTKYQAEKLLSDWQERGWLIIGDKGARFLSPAVLQAISEPSEPPETT